MLRLRSAVSSAIGSQRRLVARNNHIAGSSCFVATDPSPQPQEVINRRSSSSSASSSSWQFLTPSSPDQRLLLGCVSYDPSVGSIWDGIKQYLISGSGGKLPNFDYVLFTNYEAQISALLEGHIDVAWNGPVAHVMAEDLSASQQEEGKDVALLKSVGMRDVDRDFRSVALIRRDCLSTSSSAEAAAATTGSSINLPVKQVMESQTIATGSSDSPQGHLVPVDWLVHTVGVNDVKIIPHDIDMGKHGDTAIGEIHALKAVVDGNTDNNISGALVSEMMYQRGLSGALSESGIDPKQLSESVVQLEDSPPVFDHCSFDALCGDHPLDDSSSSSTTKSSLGSHRMKINAFSQAILSMDMNDPCQAPILKMEGIEKSWLGPRVDPGGAVRTALHRNGLARATSVGQQKQRRTFSSTPIITKEKVAILGAGLSGLQSIRALRSKFDVTAFDPNEGVGGLWRENYLTYGVQVPKQLFEFPDLPFDEVKFGDFPTGEEVQRYIERYTQTFDLNDNIVLNTHVTKAVQNDDGSWTIQTKSGDGKEENHHFDKLVISTGLYSSDRPSFPEWASKANESGFKGDIMHSNELRRPEQVSGKKVVVVGNGKSAVDVAVASSDSGADSVTMLSRSPHWPTPRYIADIIPFQYVFLSRLGQNLVLGLSGPLPGCSPSHSNVWHSVGKFIMPPIFKIVELLFAAQFRNVTGPTSPFLKTGVVEDFYGYAQVLDYSFRDKVKSGAIDWRMGSIEKLESDIKVVLTGGETIDADVIVCGTGYAKDYSIFDDKTKEKLNVESDGLYLFNHTIPTKVDNLAFVGSELAVISNISGYGLQSAWLSKFWTDELQNGIPSTDKEAMENEVKELKEWKRSWMPNTPSRASLVLLHQIHFYDRLLRDMGMAQKRKGNILSDWFMPAHSEDYSGVLTDQAEEKK